MDTENKLAKDVLNCAFTVHKNLGPGLLESAYQIALEAELTEAGIPFKAQYEIPLEYKGRTISTAYRLDLLVADQLIVELKAVESISRLHLAQTLTYLKLTGCTLGLILNFNVILMKRGIKRVINSPKTLRS
jgi:GxxExxY protein